MTTISFTFRNPFTFGVQPPPPLHARVWNALTSSPRLNRVTATVGDKLTEYAIRKAITNSEQWKRGVEAVLDHVSTTGLPANEVREVAEIVFLAIQAGLRTTN